MLVLPTKEELEFIIYTSGCTHPDIDVLIIDKIKAWDRMTDEQRHRAYCPDDECCKRSEPVRQFRNHFYLLEIDVDDINENSEVILKDKGYAPWTILYDKYDYDGWDEIELAKGYDKMDFCAIPTLTFNEMHNGSQEIDYFLDRHEEAEAFMYHDIVLSLYALPIYDDDVEDYLCYKERFVNNLNGLIGIE